MFFSDPAAAFANIAAALRPGARLVLLVWQRREDDESMRAIDAARAVDRLRETLAAHYTDESGVAFDSHSWLVTPGDAPCADLRSSMAYC